MTVPAAALAAPLQAVTGPPAVLVALVTQLGDAWLLFAAVAVTYWLDDAAPWVGRGLDRERAALVVALLVGAMALLETLKPIFASPRPPGYDVAPRADFLPVVAVPAYEWLATAEGYSFPSGHALASTIVWGGLAWGVRVGRLRTRAAVAAVLVAAVSASRVLLGVHYPVDVAAGVAAGLAYLVAVVRWVRDPGRAFAIATAVALAGLPVGGPTAERVATVGLAVGVTATWLWLDGELLATPATRPGSVVTLALGLLVAAPVLAASVLVAMPAWAVALAGAAGGGLLLAVPLAGERLGLGLAGSAVES